MNRPRRRRVATTFTTLVAGLLAFGSTLADEVLEEVSAFDIPDQPLDQALLEFSKQADVQIIMAAETTRDLEALGIHGQQRNRDALERLLADRGLQYTEHSNRTIAVHQVVAADAGGDSDSGNGRPAGASQSPVMMAKNETKDLRKQRKETEERGSGENSEKSLDEIVVTGTSLRGFAPESSPLQVYTREDIQKSGVTSTEQFIRTLPQNFGGGSSEFAASGLPNDDNTERNNTLGTGANLRGLGSGATLVLLNGNRLAPTSTIGDFVDLSLIPLSTLERVDVLTDGASSIYGGDAVAGVINFVLRDDFEGAETALRYGTVTEGQLEEYRVNQVIGKAWSSGNILATVELYDRDDLVLSDRLHLAEAVSVDGQPNEVTDAFRLLPEQRRTSGLVSLNQDVTEALEISGTALYADKKIHFTSKNFNDVGTSHSTIDSESLYLSIAGDYELSSDWSASADMTYSQIGNYIDVQGQNVRGPFVREEATDTDLWSADLTVTGRLFDIPGGTVRAAVGSHYREESILSQTNDATNRDGAREVTAVYAEILIPVVGQGNALTGMAGLDINVSGRMDDYSDFGTTVNPKIGLLWRVNDGLNIRSSYSTSFSPPPLGRVFALDRVGGVFPYGEYMDLLGLPVADPALADTDYLVLLGTGPNLDAQTSRTFTGGADLAVGNGPNSWTVRSTYYDIHFDGRLGVAPMPGNQDPNSAPAIYANDPSSLPEGTVYLSPSDDVVNSILSTLNRILFPLGDTGLENIGVINTALQTRNLASTKTRGVDIQIDYGREVDVGTFSAGINANYLIDFIQQGTVTTPEVETVDSLHNPVDLQLRGRIGFTRGGLAGNLFVNYVDNYQTEHTENGQPIGSWTTVDLYASYEFQNSDRTWLDGMAVNFSVLNALDAEPPRTPSNASYRITAYDPANASPLGRLVALEIRKSF